MDIRKYSKGFCAIFSIVSEAQLNAAPKLNAPEPYTTSTASTKMLSIFLCSQGTHLYFILLRYTCVFLRSRVYIDQSCLGFNIEPQRKAAYLTRVKRSPQSSFEIIDFDTLKYDKASAFPTPDQLAASNSRQPGLTF